MTMLGTPGQVTTRQLWTLVLLLVLLAGGVWLVVGRGEAPAPGYAKYQDSSGGSWWCRDAGAAGGYMVVDCLGQERLDPTGVNGVRCFTGGGLPDGRVYCSDMRGGKKDLTAGR